jgi:hypothetical protein
MTGWVIAAIVAAVTMLVIYITACLAFMAEMSQRILGDDTPDHPLESVSREVADGLEEGSIVLEREEYPDGCRNAQ